MTCWASSRCASSSSVSSLQCLRGPRTSLRPASPTRSMGHQEAIPSSQATLSIRVPATLVRPSIRATPRHTEQGEGEEDTPQWPTATAPGEGRATPLSRHQATLLTRGRGQHTPCPPLTRQQLRHSSRDRAQVRLVWSLRYLWCLFDLIQGQLLLTTSR